MFFISVDTLFTKFKFIMASLIEIDTLFCTNERVYFAFSDSKWNFDVIDVRVLLGRAIHEPVGECACLFVEPLLPAFVPGRMFRGEQG